ncbi:MAG: D-alanyl-D-alanine carboxypeptidase family protein [Heliobacteriaceae bacterium]|jgi:D-alanyl-D-alanine carboxypeptidase|nr:D-alanyl-D-alanine carboxypeptidase family protein [Heliobacteriaceae bacterium]
MKINDSILIYNSPSAEGPEQSSFINPNSVYDGYLAAKTNENTTDFSNILNGTYNADKYTYAGTTHYRYPECKQSDLQEINGIKVHPKCAENFIKMQKDARKEGVSLNIISGFRSINYQKTVFAKKFIDKKNPTPEEMKKRIKFSAPPGFSEHSTGLAIDINSLEQSFQNTKEYEWLLKNAGNYGFELSFSKNNSQNLGFEPWHWRYVGDEESKKTFEKARTENI